MNYTLTQENEKAKDRISAIAALRELYQHLKGSRAKMSLAFVFLLISSITVIWTPFLIGDITNKFIPTLDKDGLLSSLLGLAAVYIVGSVASYFQIRVMGQVGQQVVFNIRSAVFNKLQSLPLQFFNQNKSGDLISRINNDSEKMSQAFSETLLRFTGDIVVIVGIAIVMVRLNRDLGLIALATLGVMLLITFMLSGWIKSRMDRSLQRLGEMSGQIQESLSNFKVTVVFNRRDYFRESFAEVNENNRKAATMAGIAVATLAPIYNFAGSFASGVILIASIHILIIDKIMVGAMPEFGTLLAFILYASSFFGPLREMAELFSQIQVAIASWSRIFRLLRLQTNLRKVESEDKYDGDSLMHFHNVSFGYNEEAIILNKINGN